ncbi:hypothetical protein [Commensalibacter nepenthis]|uniref:Uncharacterized protein n=1 Tax=Commensalibacter nepenthis TaxID=3043872 RepID=A0ABT6QAI8_9PROT|nr:hypothetical protein [Commensalibacter sp. TBRC 10068]MDI2113922.1 hypothetical protein [Commensalibacter sp. TBRC 10068]
MKRSLTYLFIIFCMIVIHTQTIQAEEPEFTHVIDWTNLSGYKDNNKNYKSNLCGKMFFKLLKNMRVEETSIILRPHPTFQDSIKEIREDLKVGASYGDGVIDSMCRTQRFDNRIIFDNKLRQWKPIDSGYNVNLLVDNTNIHVYNMYVLKGSNVFGWLITNILSTDDDKVKEGQPPYSKMISFCLFNKDQTKQLCGDGNVQYILDKKHLGTTAHDYTPTLIKILNTAQFLDDK